MTPPRLSLPLAVALLAAGGVGGWFASRENATHETEVACLSLRTSISCGPVADPGQADYRVPVDVAWTNSKGFHMSGRPECLPVDGNDTSKPVSVTWTEVEVDGRTWKQVVGVRC